LKRALITGVTGQDGAYLAKLLLEKDYAVFGTHRHGSPTGNARLRELGIEREVVLLPLDLCEQDDVLAVVNEVQPEEVYNLAAQSSVASAFREPLRTADINALGALRMLEALRRRRSEARFFQASSSQLFGNVNVVPQCETTPFQPSSAYGTAKLFAHWSTVNYRAAHGMFAASGLLFNHESPLRGPGFVTRKVSDGVARIKLGMLERLHLGNLEAKRDWGYAGDYVEAMWRMLQQDSPDDYVIASGEAHTVRELVTIAFEAIGTRVEWEGSGIEERGVDGHTGDVVVDLSPDLLRPAEVHLLLGDAKRAHQRLGWKPRVGFGELVHMMVEADLRRLQQPSRHARDTFGPDVGV